MVKYTPADLDRIFAALSDATRRGILAALALGPKPVSELARPFAMSLPGFMKHLDVLQEARLLTRVKEGRIVTCTLEAEPMREALDWLTRYQAFWDARLDALARYLEKEHKSWKPPQSDNVPRSPSGGTTKPRRKRSGKPGSTRKH